MIFTCMFSLLDIDIFIFVCAYPYIPASEGP